MIQQQLIKSTLGRLKGIEADLKGKEAIVGFDGFIDEIIHVVDKRHSPQKFTRISTMGDFSDRIARAAGKSLNMELVPAMEKIGGNGPIMALAVSGFGCRVTCIGLLGEANIHPVFHGLGERCKLVSLGDPGHTDALEFRDGKIMLGKHQTLSRVNWENLGEKLGEDKFISSLQRSDLVACTNWTMLAGVPQIISNIEKKIPPGSGTLFFFDLADPRKREAHELEQLMKQLYSLNKKSPVCLGLNISEAEQVAAVSGIAAPEDGTEGLERAAESLRRRLELHCVVIHSVKFASASLESGSAAVAGPYSHDPKITTGAGDHFNGGFSTALMAGLPLAESLICGTAVSGWYVRHGGPSPEFSDILGLLEQWGKGELAD